MLKILLPLDGSEFAENAVPHALAMARSFNGRITLLRVVTPTEFRMEDTFSRVDWRLRRHQAHTYLESIAATIHAAGISYELLVDEGRPPEVIQKTAKDQHTQLLVMSTHGHGAALDFPRGGVTSKMLATFDASVLLVGPNAAPKHADVAQYRHILAPIDGSFTSESSLRVAAMLASEQDAGLTAACIAQPPRLPFLVQHNCRAVELCSELAEITQAAAERRLVELRAQLSPAVDLQTAILPGETPADALGEAVRRFDADLLVASDELFCGANGFRSPEERHEAYFAPFPALLLAPHGIAEAFCARQPTNEPDDVTATEVS